MELLRNRLAANLRQAREEAGLSPEELAQRCELEPGEIAALERAVELPGIDIAARLASALDIEIDELTAGIAWDPESQRFAIAA